ncbi:DUF3857 domain-containing protein [Marinoscillum sp. MHG1-6]|uniref:DUF3857 domain-containing protein n=1 Tax=Marinoscillum sp. MHG1-6 TaxID=2959627 RepID=UPI0021577D59|nr:DUF3857 domain-containing protein [Marinoscillum sp. MHG1-6]
MVRFIKSQSRHIFFFLLCSVHLLAQGQMKADEEYAHFKKLYPNDQVIYLTKSETVNYTIVNDSVKTTIDVYHEILHLGENTAGYAGEKVFSSSFSEVSNLEAYTLVPNKRKYRRIEVEEFKSSYDKNSYVFYDDNKEISFTYPGVQKGAKCILKYTKTVNDPRMIGTFFFESYIPIHRAVYEVKRDPNISISQHTFNQRKLDITVNESTTKSGELKTSFSVNKIDKVKFDVDCPSFSYLAASVYCPVSSYQKVNGESSWLISSPETLHQWYRTFLNGIQGTNPEVKNLIGGIIKDDDPVLEKVRKIYYWVQANIKYIAFEDGMRGFIPHPGEYVISKRYGDCKDMASAIVSMLRAADIEAYYTWIGTRDLPYKYSETPSPITDNHMIATFIHEGKVYYLDATGQYTPIDLPTSMIQGKECLISMGEDKFRVETVPVIPKETNMMIDSVEIEIADGNIKGTGRATLKGYSKVFNSYSLIKSNQTRVENHVEQLLGKGSNKFEIEDFELSDLENLSKPTVIDYSFHIQSYYRAIGDDIYINLVLDKAMTEAQIENRTVALENEYKYLDRHVVRLKIPEEYTVQKLPENQKNTNEQFGYAISYEADENYITVTKDVFVDYLIMHPEAFDSWNQIISEYAKASRQALILSLKKEASIK